MRGKCSSRPIARRVFDNFTRGIVEVSVQTCLHDFGMFRETGRAERLINYLIKTALDKITMNNMPIVFCFPGHRREKSTKMSSTDSQTPHVTTCPPPQQFSNGHQQRTSNVQDSSSVSPKHQQHGL